MFSRHLYLVSFLLPLLSVAKETSNGLRPPPVLTPQPLNITTLTANADKGSIFECWSVADLKVSATPGIQGALVGSLTPGSALNYFNIPAKFDGGIHNAPVIQWVYFTSGKAVISLPTSNETATIKGGANGLILAADIADVSTQGHTTVYPGHTQTVGLTIPLVNNTLPSHTVLHPGPCTTIDQDIEK